MTDRMSGHGNRDLNSCATAMVTKFTRTHKAKTNENQTFCE